MTPSVPDPQGRVDRCDSLNTVYLVINGAADDKNFTPPGPALVRLLEAEREKLRRWGALKDPAAEKPAAEDSASQPAEESEKDQGAA
jgi:hypothetical protein